MTVEELVRLLDGCGLERHVVYGLSQVETKPGRLELTGVALDEFGCVVLIGGPRCDASARVATYIRAEGSGAADGVEPILHAGSEP